MLLKWLAPKESQKERRGGEERDGDLGPKEDPKKRSRFGISLPLEACPAMLKLARCCLSLAGRFKEFLVRV